MGLVHHQQEEPNEHDGDGRNWDGDSKPLEPGNGHLHLGQRDQILGRGNRGTLTPNVSGQGYGELRRKKEKR